MTWKINVDINESETTPVAAFDALHRHENALKLTDGKLSSRPFQTKWEVVDAAVKLAFRTGRENHQGVNGISISKRSKYNK